MMVISFSSARHIPRLLVSLAGTMLPTAAFPLAAQSSRLTGAVQVDLARGYISGDVCMSEMAEAGDTITFVLNRTLSIKRVTGALEAPIGVTLEMGGAAVRYTVRRDSVSSALLASGRQPPLCLTYSGSSPVYDVAAGDYRYDDNSALIAFNGSTVRARGASRWYPAFIGSETALAEEAVRFDLKVACEDCEQIYINGSSPHAGPSASFSSATARELLLVAGRLPTTRAGGTLIIGEVTHPDTAAAFVAVLEEIQAFHAAYLGLPPLPLPDLVQLDPLRRPRRGELWGFYSDPALSLLGTGIPRLTQVLLGDSVPPRRNVYTFLAHELAHRYFGWTMGTETSQRDFFGEPFATFLELKAMRARFGEADYRRALRSLRDRVLNGPDPVPPDLATQPEIERGRYGYNPLLLYALESIVGEARMQTLLRAVVAAPEEEKRRADLEFLHRTALSAGISEVMWQRWESECLRMPLGENGCLRTIAE